MLILTWINLILLACLEHPGPEVNLVPRVLGREVDLPQVVLFERNRATRDNERGTSFQRGNQNQRKGKIILERAFRKSRREVERPAGNEVAQRYLLSCLPTH